jgi:hypothetical protein
MSKVRNQGPARKSRINKLPTSAAEGGRETEQDIAGNVRERGEDPSPDDRARGERSRAEPAGAENSRR